MASATQRPIRIGVQVAPQHALYPTIRDAVARARRRRRRHRLQLGPLLPAQRRPRRPALRVVDDARGDRRADQPRRARRTRQLQQLPQRRPAGRHGPHHRPHQRRPVHLRHGIGLVREATTTSTATSSAPSASDWMRSPRSLPRIEARWAKLNPPPTRHIPVLIGGGGEKKTLKLVARHADIWHSFSDGPTLQAQAGHPRRALRGGWPRHRRDRDLDRTARSHPGRCRASSSSWARPCSRWASPARTTTSPP